MIVGGWARRLPPLPGELLTSCLARNAYAHGLPPYRFLSLFWPGDPVWNRDFDRRPRALGRGGAPRPDWLADIAGQLRVPVATVEAATLEGMREALAGGRAPERGDTSLLLSAGVYHRTRTRHALQFCTACLAEGVPHFRRAWRLGFAVACTTHGCPLVDACPRCDAPVVPHRTMTPRLADCHTCGAALDRPGGRQHSLVVPAPVVGLQLSLTSVLDGIGDLPGPWRGREAFDAVRALLAVSATAFVHDRLRTALGLPAPAADRDDRLRFEQCRLPARVEHLETVAAWLADWPCAFRHGVGEAGLTQRTFARNRLPPVLAAEVAELDPGQRRDSRWKPLLDEELTLKRLRRRDKPAYRALRARRIMAAAGP